jgi:UDP-N-acetylmuramoyl-L-alanyl-D-glutamate--2,6-diaminopimelate ligase
MTKQINLPSIWPVSCHTDYIGKNSTFVAIKGQKYDGITFVPLALQKGARTIVAEHTADIAPEIIQAIKAADAQLMFVANARRSLALLCSNAWGNPSDKLKIIAITGTKGKTTTAWLLHHLLLQAGHQVALLSSVKNKINDQEFDTELTTQHPDYLHAFFYACVNAGIKYVIMEVAAQALSLHRAAGLEFDGIIFTNFAQAHGEFYTSEQEYYAAKTAIFNQAKPNAHIFINIDDSKGSELIKNYNAIGFGTNAAVHAMYPQSSMNGIIANIVFGKENILCKCPALIGSFNLYNILAASGMALSLGISSEAICTGLQTFKGVPGRLERYDLSTGAACFIDHAHNPLSFEAVLTLLRTFTDHLIVVAGAGGDRDKHMRPILGQLMAEYADQVFITTDNPRSENAADIIAQIYAGVSDDKKHKITCEIDREVAIRSAIDMSRKKSIIALLGKGPEQYQLIGTQKIPFSERAIIQNL